MLIPVDRKWCHGCTLRRQEAEALGISVVGMTRVGAVLEDLEVPRLTCQCGGDPTAPHHECSLGHIQWVWREAQK